MAQSWMALGDHQEAYREFRQLPLYAQNHAEAIRVRDALLRALRQKGL
jgi:hypothetical protein